MWNVDALTNHQLNNLDHQTIPHSSFQSVSKSMLSSTQPITSELASVTTHPPPSQPIRHSSSHPLGIRHPTVIRSLVRHFSPPFKPFGSREPSTDEELVVSLDSPLTMPSVLSSDLAPQNQFQNHSNPEVMVLSTAQARPMVMIPSSSQHKRSQTRFASLAGDLNEPDCPRSSGDEVLRQFTLDSDVEVQDPPSLKRPRRNGDKSTRQKSANPFSASQSSVSDLSIHPNSSRSPTFARSPKPSSRTFTRPGLLQDPTSSNLLDQMAVDDEDILTKSSNLSLNGIPTAGRAATARRALFASSDTTSFSWAGLERPSEPLPGSSTITATSPRLRSTRLLSPNTTASPNNLAGPGSPASVEEVDSRALKPTNESILDIKPAKKTKTKSATDSSRPKRPKPPAQSPTSLPAPSLPAMPEASVSTSNPCKNENPESQVKRRIATLLPATEPDESGQYESSTCHQCRVKTTRPKMICDQSQDPNCVVRVCHTCLMVRTVYDDMPELRPPIFQFVPGGTMLCVKCRDICPCASCRRRRGEKEHSRRGLGSALKGFYGLTPEEREQALTRKKEKQDAARQKKESRPPSEKKPPSTFRREVSSIRGTFDDDEHERLQGWAPLPVFPPLPKRRKKKRKRLEIMEGVRLDSQASDTDSDSSCSDSDTYEETDSDSRSLSSESSYHSNSRAHVVLGPASFQLPLSSNTRSTVPLLTKRWRSNFSRPIKEDQPSFSKRALQVAARKSQGDKAPVVWIKSGAMVQARKPPTTEFMQRLAEEQKGRSTSDSNTVDNADQMMSPLAIIGQENRPLNPLDPAPHDKMSIPKSNSPSANVPSTHHIDASHFRSLSSLSSNYSLRLAHIDDNHSKVTCTCNIGQLEPSIESLENPLSAHSDKCALYGSTSYSKPMPLSDDLGMCSANLNPSALSLMVESGLADHHPYEMQIEGIKAFEGMAESAESSNEQRGFDRSVSSPVDLQSYLAGLTDEQLTAVLKEGHYVMAKQGFAISPDGLPVKFNEGTDQFSTGISPELISASLPFAGSGEGHPAGEPRGAGDRAGRLLNELTEEDQEARLIEAANWAAVWGATDGAGGFMVTKSGDLDDHLADQDDRKCEPGRESLPIPTYNSSNSRAPPDLGPSPTMLPPSHLNLPNGSPSDPPPGLMADAHLPAPDPQWVNHASGADKELFLRAMKSRVGDEWLTDVMPLDSC